MYQCRHCAFATNSIRQYVYHYHFHDNVPNIRYICCEPNCPRSFKTYSAFKSHIFRDHSDNAPKRNFQQNNVQDDPCVTFRCNKPECLQQLLTFQDFTTHLKSHISYLEPVDCPFVDCDTTFKIKSSFSSHLSRKHKLRKWKNLLPCYVTDLPEHSTIGALGNQDSDNTQAHDLSDGEMINNELQVDGQTEQNFLQSLALFYLKLLGKHLLPESIIEVLIVEFQRLYDINQMIVQDSLCSNLKSHDLPDHLLREMKQEFF
ncbi:hypothetical protein SNE40_015847 [Patella caerulea]|uniref:C2H2-type domain-containing protein n=1 Tax=Patella caerulea TaxID=87958 RepID=A0AAN8JQ04_PATCE